MEKTFVVNGKDIKVQDYKHTGESVTFSLNGKTYSFQMINRDGPEMILSSGMRFKAAVGVPNREGDMMVMANGREAVIAGAAGKKMKKSGGHAGGLTSPMPGKIFKILKD